jgi:hypothetical protein
MSQLIVPGQPRERSIALQTRDCNNIPNVQSLEVAPHNARSFAKLKTDYTKPGIVFRTDGVTGIYNCHGLVFASRRTQIVDGVHQLVLADDRYVEMTRANALAGDVIVYWGPDGDWIHSGLVVERPSEATMWVARVCSKWGAGPEVLHPETLCPYMEQTQIRRFYRVQG